MPQEVDVPDAADASDRHPALVAIGAWSDGGYVAILDADPGNRTLLSPDGSSWTDDQRFWLNQGGNITTADFSNFAFDQESGDFLAARGFNEPVWLGTDGAEPARTTRRFRLQERQIAGLTIHRSDFVFVSTEVPRGSEVWKSADGNTWTMTEDDRDHFSALVSNAGDTIFSYGNHGSAARFGQPMIRVYGGPETQFDLIEQLGLSDSPGPVDVWTAPATGRNLVTGVGTDSAVKGPSFSFIDLDEPGEISTYRASSVPGGVPQAVCPQLASGEYVVLVAEADGIGTAIEVWADVVNPRLGAGRIDEATDDQQASTAVMRRCAASPRQAETEGLMAVGARCTDDALVDNAYKLDECEAELWVSSDGFTWKSHPASSALASHGLGMVIALSGSRSGWILSARPVDGAEDTLWLATTTELVQVPIGNTATRDDLRIDYIAVNDERVLLGSDAELFVGDLHYLLEAAKSE